MKEIIKDLLKWYIEKTNVDIYPSKQLKELFAFSICHHIEGMVIDFIMDTQPIPNKLAEELEKVKRDIERNCKHYEKLVKEIGNRFQVDRIKFVFLKGIVLSQTLYKKNYHRSYGDMDILVLEKDIEKVSTILKEKGFQQGDYDKIKKKVILASRKQIVFQRMYTHEIYNFVRIQGGFVENIDINFNFSWNGLEYRQKKAIQGLVENIISSDKILYSNNMYMFNPEDQFIHLCCHLYNEITFFALDPLYNNDVTGIIRHFRLSWIFDIILLMTNKCLDYDAIIVKAKENGCLYMVRQSLSLIDSFYEVMPLVKDKFNVEKEGNFCYYNSKRIYVDYGDLLSKAIFTQGVYDGIFLDFI